MSDTAHLREPKPLSDEAALRARLSAYKVILHDATENEVEVELGDILEIDDLMQLYQSHTRQLEQRVLEALPTPDLKQEPVGTAREAMRISRNLTLEEVGTKLKRVFNQTKEVSQ